MKSTTRRTFLKSTLATTSAVTLGSAYAPAILSAQNLNSKLNIAVIGIGGRGGANIAEMVAETNGSEKLLAFCDVNANTLAAQSEHYGVEHRYKDYREMFDKQADEFDAVLVATLDHTHGIIACTAMELGLHCYCEKPLANSVWETRQMANFAKAKKLCTQTGTQVRSWPSAPYYRAIEWVRSGALGEITEVHNWCGGTYVPPNDPEGEMPVPQWLDYDLWLGPSPYFPYHEMWLSFSKYGFWHSGLGWISGMGPHTIDLFWTALNLSPPTIIEVDGPKPPHALYNRDNLHVTFHHKKADGKTLKAHWYDGTRRPEGIAADMIDPAPGAGVLFVGENGSLQVHYGYMKLFPAARFADVKPPEQTFPPSVGHHRQWLEAIKANKPEMCECRFEYAAPYMEAIAIAANMHRESVDRVTWNPATMKTDSEAVNQRFKPPFCDGWRFPVCE
jgi:predicted dehydrogenase